MTSYLFVGYLLKIQKFIGPAFLNVSTNGSTDKRTKLILSLAEPDKSWPTYDVTFHYSYGKCPYYIY